MPNEVGYLGNPKLKNVNTSHGFTEYQIEELRKCSNDVFYFIRNYIKIRHVDEEGLIPLKLRGYQEKLIQSFVDNRFVICKFPRQYGKALDLNTPIKTLNGWSNMGSLKVGDKIYGPDGKLTNISFITPIMHNHDCYEITFDNGEKINADADHLWKIYHGWDHKEITVTTRELIPLFKNSNKKGYGTYIPISSPLHYSKKCLPINPYVLGIWLGDGYSAGGRYICLHSDNKIIKKQIENCGYRVKIQSSKKGKTGKKIDRSNIIGLAKTLRKNNLKNNKHIPEIYLNSSLEQRLELLQGLMDTDGFCNPKVGTCEFYQKKLLLINQVRELLTSLGIKSRLRFRIIKGQKYYTLVFNTHLCVFKLPRKTDRQLESKHHTKNYNLYIQSIKKVKSVPVRCIQVDNEDHMFLCGKTMIPTHNSTSYVAYGLWYLIFHKNVEVALLANKGQTARELLSRIQIAWENLPLWMQQGIVVWNKGSIELENGSKIIATNTASNSIRGYSFNCISGNSIVSIKNKNVIKDISIFNLIKEFGVQIPEELERYQIINRGMQTNKYSNIYWRIIQNAQKRNWTRSNSGCYVERHHIIPKCFSKNNKKENLVFLTAKEHFICHKLLIKMYEGKEKSKMICSLFIMCKNPNNILKVSSKKYEVIRANYSEEKRKLRLNTHHSQETKDKISNSNKDKKLSEETKMKISLKNKGRLKGIKRSKEICKSISEALKGKTHSIEHVNKINKNPEKIRKTAEKHRGMKRSLETRLKQSKAKENYIPWNKNKKGSMSFGFKWFHDPITKKSIMANPLSVPDGFLSGRK